jgi:hypothetical protein
MDLIAITMNTGSIAFEHTSQKSASLDTILQVTLEALKQGDFITALDQFNDEFAFIDHALELEFSAKDRLKEFFAKRRRLITISPPSVAATVHRSPWLRTTKDSIGGIERCITKRAVAIPTLEWRLRTERHTLLPSGPIFGCKRPRCNWTVAATENRVAGSRRSKEPTTLFFAARSESLANGSLPLAKASLSRSLRSKSQSACAVPPLCK